MAPNKKLKKTAVSKAGSAKSDHPVERVERMFKKRVEKMNVKKFASDAWNALMNPYKFFNNISSNGNYSDAIVQALMYGMIAFGLHIVFNIASITVLDAAAAIIAFAAGSVLLLFSFAGILMLFSYAAKGSRDFEIALRATAAAMFMYPLAYAAYNLAFTYWLLVFFSLLIDMYVVFLIYVATEYAMKGDVRLSRVAAAVCAALVFFFHVNSMSNSYMFYKNQQLSLKHAIGKNL
ncbi:MAG: hypothetical protein FWD15_03380 [Alphaproteobacteria bacterium]|nr:hypothetical protein [Alphaproteobacteria bacterium]